MPDKKNLGELQKLTDAERMIIYRRRLNKSQAEMAKIMKISYNAYGAMEREGVELIAPPVVTPLATHEKCFLYRRRAGFTRDRVATEMGRSKQWVTLMERGRAPTDELVTYWEC